MLGVSLRTHLLALRAADDRRYAEVALEREKALRIKETADDRALSLAREIQTYKDEKANELREQINSERGLYVTKAELSAAVRELQAAIEPLKQYTNVNAGRRGGISLVWAGVLGVMVIITGIAAVAAVIIAIYPRAG